MAAVTRPAPAVPLPGPGRRGSLREGAMGPRPGAPCFTGRCLLVTKGRGGPAKVRVTVPALQMRKPQP